jgi:hypothetical protein
MKLLNATLLLFVLVLMTSCQGRTQWLAEPLAADPTVKYEYRVGLGYGFLDKAVQVAIDGQEVLSIVGTDEIEQFAQLLGTKMLESGSSPRKDITVRVIVDGGKPYEQAIDLGAGMFIHIYYERTGLRVFNTPFLVLE